MPQREQEYLPGGYPVVRVYDKALKRSYTASGTHDSQVEDGLEIIDGPALTPDGSFVDPQFDVTKTGQPTQAAASTEGASK